MLEEKLIAELEGKIINERDMLKNLLREKREELLVNQSPDESDHKVGTAAADTAAGQMRLHSRKKSQCDEALERIHNGEYDGICIECKEEIKTIRLKAVPWSPLCIRCADDLERRITQTDYVTYDHNRPLIEAT
jgi:RNA polymerase-binding transcription factor DksA